MPAICVKSVEIGGKLWRGRGRGVIKIAAKPACAVGGGAGAREGPPGRDAKG